MSLEAEELMNDVLRKHLMSATAQRDELLAALKLVVKEKAPIYHDCTDNGEVECAWCIARKTIATCEPKS